MRLGLSTDAAPGAALEELLDACVRRGMAAVEIRVGDECADAARAFLTTPQPDILLRPVAPCGILVREAELTPAVARQALSLHVPLILEGPAHRPLLRRARQLAGEGIAALPLLGGAAEGWLEDVALTGVPVAWQADATACDVAADAADILRHAHLLAYVRLVGGGPEALMQEGRGIGSVMRQLTMASFNGPLILTPSSQRFRMAWAAWLGRRGGWGCGSKADREMPQVLA
jgi:hypothetical protein